MENENKHITPNTQKMKDSMKELEQFFQQDVPRMQESDFRDRIVPMLIDPNRRDISPWLDVAGSGQRPIDIYRGAEFLLRCPAIIKPISFVKTVEPADSYSQHVALSIQKDDLHKGLGQRYIGNVMHSKVSGMRFTQEEVQSWLKVFHHFGIDPKTFSLMEPGKNTSSNPRTSSDKKEDLTGDDFFGDGFDMA